MARPKKEKYIEVRGSAIHGRGVFAVCGIPKGTDIIQYTGRKLTKAQAARSSSRYIFELNKRCDIEGRNSARYINHSCKPNCEAVIVSNREIWITALRRIKPGEELTYNYGYSLEEYKDYPCYCRARRCAGYILDKKHWKKVKNAKA